MLRNKYHFIIILSFFFFKGLTTTIAHGEDCLTQCHQDIQSGRLSHPNIQKCSICHGEIGAYKEGNGHVLITEKNAEKSCLKCHKKIIDNLTYLHGPLKKGKCLACHTPHSSDYEFLLIEQYPKSNYVKYSKAEYKLCFKCHKRDLLMFPDTSFATQFRDKEKNLHFYHVKKPKRGENCRLCHAIHGSVLPKLMAKKVPFGRWMMPIGFTIRPKGGACVPGCHDPKQYIR